jgi:preprotein translocase subunit YajC
MFISPAYAQSAGGMDAIATIFPMIAVLVIFYFLLIRPQQARAKAHKEMVLGIRRGDTVVLASGIIGKVAKAKEGEAEIDVEIAKETVVKVLRGTISEVRSKNEAPKDAAA